MVPLAVSLRSPEEGDVDKDESDDGEEGLRPNRLSHSVIVLSELRTKM